MNTRRCVGGCGVWTKAKTKLCGCGCYWLNKDTGPGFLLCFFSTGLQTQSLAISQNNLNNDFAMCWVSKKESCLSVSVTIYPVSSYFGWVWGSSAPLCWMIKYGWTDGVLGWKAEFPSKLCSNSSCSPVSNKKLMLPVWFPNAVRCFRSILCL